MILVTGGCGYIGSHCALKFSEAGYQVAVFDNLSTGSVPARDFLLSQGIEFFKGDLTSPESLSEVFKQYDIDGIIHFAGLIRVEESVMRPEKYFLNNVRGTENLFNEAVRAGIKNIVFSSSCAVYGEPQYLPLDENHVIKPLNPYGKTKAIVEKIARQFDEKFGLKTVSLRYFNAAGADEQLRLGENHVPETHLIPNIINSIIDDIPFKIFGTERNTRDGSCIRDYINVTDLADVHLSAYKYLLDNNCSDTFNIGTEKGYSVKEVIAVTEKITGKKVNIIICPPRDGDADILVADASKAEKMLSFRPTRSLDESILTAFEYEKSKRKGLK